ncbi:hypothetical protein N9954_07865 [Maribacter sp.]|nr:hypothetical protein [Maribacter sp.]
MALLEGIFGPSKKEIWQQMAKDIGGEYIDGGFWKSGVLRYQHDNWEMLLDTFTRSHGKSSSTYTRLRVPFLNKDGLYFKIYREGFFSGVGKFFGMQDLQIKDQRFNEHFIIKGNSQEKIEQLLNDYQIKMLFDMVPKVSVEIKQDSGLFKKKHPEGIDVLYFEQLGTMRKKEELSLLFRLFTTLLDRLVQIDSAYEDDPGLRLE